jgi:hypothetical protein
MPGDVNLPLDRAVRPFSGIYGEVVLSDDADVHLRTPDPSSYRINGHGLGHDRPVTSQPEVLPGPVSQTTPIECKVLMESSTCLSQRKPHACDALLEDVAG